MALGVGYPKAGRHFPDATPAAKREKCSTYTEDKIFAIGSLNNVFLKRRGTIRKKKKDSGVPTEAPPNPHPRTPPAPHTFSPGFPRSPTQLSASAEPRCTKGPSVKARGLAEVTFSQVDARLSPRTRERGARGTRPQASPRSRARGAARRWPAEEARAAGPTAPTARAAGPDPPRPPASRLHLQRASG